MRAGTLDRRISLQQQVVTRDAFGGEVISWLEIVTIWAAKKESLGLEAYRADQVAQAEASALWRIRYRAGVQTKHRLVDDAEQAWNIEAVSEIGRREGLELRCTRVID